MTSFSKLYKYFWPCSVHLTGARGLVPSVEVLIDHGRHPSLSVSGRSIRISHHFTPVINAVVTPLRRAASYEPRIAILGIWGDTWLTRGKYGIYVAVRGSYGALTGSTWRLLEILPRKISTFYCRVSYVTVTRIPSLVLRNTWYYVIIRRRKFWFPKFCVAHTRRLYAKVWPRH